MPNDWVSGNPKQGKHHVLEWAWQADFPGKLDLFPFGQEESRKSNGLNQLANVNECSAIKGHSGWNHSLVETWRKPLSPLLFR